MNRIVLDTNVLISGTFWQGASSAVLEYIDSGGAKLVLTAEILEEYLDVLHREEILEKTTEKQHHAADSAVQKLISMSVFVEPSKKLYVVKKDPEDNKFLEAAVESGAEVIVSNDHHLLDLKSFDGIQIMKPEEYLQRVRK